MTKPALIRPRGFELVGGLLVVTLVAGRVLSRNGPRSSSAEQPAAASERSATTTEYRALPVRVRQEQERDRRAEPIEAKAGVGPAKSASR